MTPVRMTRRSAVRALGFVAAGGALAWSSGTPGLLMAPRVVHAQTNNDDPALSGLGDQVQRLMRDTGVPGVAIGLRINGRNYSAGWGVTTS
jgi:hypothetical protein